MWQTIDILLYIFYYNKQTDRTINHPSNPKPPETPMKTTTPPWLAQHIVSFATLALNGEEHTYAVISPEFSHMHKTPEVFAICSAEGVIAISETYPEEYRELGITHEIMEFLDKDQCEHVCVRALKRELELAEEKGFDMRKYVKFRKDFFRSLISYYRQTPQMLKEGMLEKMEASLAHLLTL